MWDSWSVPTLPTKPTPVTVKPLLWGKNGNLEGNALTHALGYIWHLSHSLPLLPPRQATCSIWSPYHRAPRRTTSVGLDRSSTNARTEGCKAPELASTSIDLFHLMRRNFSKRRLPGLRSLMFAADTYADGSSASLTVSKYHLSCLQFITMLHFNSFLLRSLPDGPWI